MKTLQIISGIILIMFGIGLIIIPFAVSEKWTFFTLIYGIPLLILGIFVLANKKEEKIERIKTKRD